ncbi:acyl-CoA dehydrogenase family protein [Chromobacterium sphagni]|uniref:Acyl-CoA dehydrogenase n=1 Tax=Chromobacterium sphagni TaxID=1903179 RepID=A0ABX3CIF3_9NEIS|nr:acyl-CoA dehydrogenase family protein [Chromobacterium sphagni]OHX21936.1 hypothetical protein BI344_05405 [Chromobacterium sphagni]
MMMPELFSNTPDAEKTGELLAWLRDYASRHVNSFLIDRRCTIPPHIVLDLGNKGVLGMQVPEEWGGRLALSHAGSCQVLRQLAGIDLALTAFVGVNNHLGTRPLLRFGSAEQKQRYLPQLASGRILAAFAQTEPAAGANPLAMTSVARACPDGDFILSGEKWWSGLAAWAGVITVIARHQDSQGVNRGYIALAIDKEQPGMRQGEEAPTMGMRGMVQNKIHFDQARIPRAAVLGSPYAGLAIGNDTMGAGRLAIAAACSGAIWRTLQLMVQYGGKRRIASGLLYQNQHTQYVIHNTWMAAIALDMLVEHIALHLDQEQALPSEVFAAAKLLASELLWTAVDAAGQLLGGRGYCDNNPLSQLARDARVTRIFEGPSETLSVFLGQSLWQGGHPMLSHLGRLAGGNALCGRLAELQTILKQRYPDDVRLEEVSARHLLLLGQALAWATLGGIVHDGDAALRGWWQERWDELHRQIFQDKPVLLPEAAALEHMIASRIGRVEQGAAGEEVLPNLLHC